MRSLFTTGSQYIVAGGAEQVSVVFFAAVSRVP